MADLENPTLIWIKGLLFLFLGLLSSVLLLMFAPNLKVAFLLCLAIWAFCRFYYFAFYVIQHYVTQPIASRASCRSCAMHGRKRSRRRGVDPQRFRRGAGRGWSEPAAPDGP